MLHGALPFSAGTWHTNMNRVDRRWGWFAASGTSGRSSLPYPRNSATSASTGSRNAASRDASLLPCNRKKAMGSRTSTTQ